MENSITSYAVAGRLLHKYIPFLTDPSWTEEVVLTLMSYMAVLSAALAIRRGAHIRMTAFDRYLSPKLLGVLDILADVAVLALGVIMLVEGWRYCTTLGGRGTYISMPRLSRFWMYLPVPVAGAAMIVFELEAVYNHIKSFFVIVTGAAAAIIAAAPCFLRGIPKIHRFVKKSWRRKISLYIL